MTAPGAASDDDIDEFFDDEQCSQADDGSLYIDGFFDDDQCSQADSGSLVTIPLNPRMEAARRKFLRQFVDLGGDGDLLQWTQRAEFVATKGGPELRVHSAKVLK